jgi:hypothetical protein
MERLFAIIEHRCHLGVVRAPHHAVSWFCAVSRYQEQRKTAKNSEQQRTHPLFVRSQNRQRPRISANDARSLAVNLPEKQRKQRELIPTAVSQALG